MAAGDRTVTARTAGQAAPRLEDAVSGIALLAGAANVIMQLGRPAVGYGVVESTVESGQLYRHPIKRTRTTLSYLAVAAFGTPADRMAYRRAVNRSHARVRSGPSSPVSYNAFDPDLQLWVAACLYRGFEDVYRFLYGPMDPVTAEHLYAEGARFGTTLQVPQEKWPADRAAFERYWQESLARVSIDDTVREYLYDMVMLGFLPRPLRLLGPFNRFVTTGFLPQVFRDEMRLPWNDRRQRRFQSLMAVIAAVNRRLPRVLRALPYNVLLWDVRRRIRTGRPLV